MGRSEETTPDYVNGKGDVYEGFVIDIFRYDEN